MIHKTLQPARNGIRTRSNGIGSCGLDPSGMHAIRVLGEAFEPVLYSIEPCVGVLFAFLDGAHGCVEDVPKGEDVDPRYEGV